MEEQSAEDMSKLIIMSVKTLAKTEGVDDKSREKAFKFIISIADLKFKFPSKLHKSLFEIIIGVNMDAKLPEFIIKYAIITLEKLIMCSSDIVCDPTNRPLLFAFTDKFKFYVRNCKNYSKDVIEKYLNVMFRIVNTLDYEGI